MKHVIVICVLVFCFSASLPAETEGELSPEESLTQLENLLKPWEKRTPNLEQGIKLLKKAVPYGTVLRKITWKQEDLRKRREKIDNAIIKLVRQLESKGVSKSDLRLQELKMFFSTVFERIYWLRGYGPWENMKKEFARGEDESIMAFKKYVRGNELNRAMLRCCLENLNISAKFRISTSSSTGFTGEQITYTYSIDIWGEGIWLSNYSLQPEYNFSEVSSPLMLTLNRKRRAVGRGGGSAGRSFIPFSNYRLILSGSRETAGRGTFLYEKPGIVRFTWKRAEKDTQEIKNSRYHQLIPDSETETWVLNAGSADGCSGLTIPILPSPKTKNQNSNGMYMKVVPKQNVVAENGAFPEILIEFGINENVDFRFPNIFKSQYRKGIWFFLFTEDLSLIATQSSWSGNFFDVEHESRSVHLCNKKRNIQGKIAIPCDLQPGRYKIVTGFGPVTHDSKYPPGDHFWQGELISEMTEFTVR